MTPENPANFHYLRGKKPPESCIIAVGGGKGGVGKSFVSTGLAIFLAHLGHNTVLVDLDLGAANIHTSFGGKMPKLGINEFLLNEKLKIDEVATPSGYPNLRLVTGCTDSFELANIDNRQRSRLMSAIFNLKADFVILDLSAGTHTSTLDFFLMATRKLMVISPEPSSVENAYRFMKAAFYRRIRRFEHQLHLNDLLNEMMTNKERYGIRAPSDLLRVISKQDPANGLRLKNIMDQLNFEIILNQARTYQDIEMGQSIRSISSKYFGTPTSLLGHFDHDNAVWQSLRKRKHLLLEYPHSRLYVQFLKIARQLANENRKRAVV